MEKSFFVTIFLVKNIRYVLLEIQNMLLFWCNFQLWKFIFGVHVFRRLHGKNTLNLTIGHSPYTDQNVSRARAQRKILVCVNGKSRVCVYVLYNLFLIYSGIWNIGFGAIFHVLICSCVGQVGFSYALVMCKALSSRITLKKT